MSDSMSPEMVNAEPVRTLGDEAIKSRPDKRKVKVVANGLEPTNNDRDDQIMNTNNSSIVSKRSVEKSYYPGEEYFRPFVRKYQRRSPIINRGYWLRMKAIDHTVHEFLKETGPKQKLVVNLGCGYDPLPFQYLGRFPDLCQNCTFIDVDYPALLRRKVSTIKESDALRAVLPNLEIKPDHPVELAKATGYRAIGCDLRQLDVLEVALRDAFELDERHVSVLFVAEVSVAYMDKAPADALLKWASKFTPDTRFCLLEQHLPDGRDHPFAQTMLKHFQKLRAPLNAICTMAQMRQRFLEAGWAADRVDIKTLWEVWGDHEFVPPSLKCELDRVEPFDEWEEFALFGAHYFLLVARSRPQRSNAPRHTSPTRRKLSTGPAVTTLYQSTLQDEKSVGRRFGAAFEIPPATAKDPYTVVHCGGHGVRERLNTCDAYTNGSLSTQNAGNVIPVALVCHTVTSFGTPETPLALLCGGRGSPDKPSAACWLLAEGRWTRQADMPRPRYRHCAVAATFQVPGHPTSTNGVLVYGGRSDKGEVLGDFIWWDMVNGWQTIDIHTEKLLDARFSAAMVTSRREGDSGILAGGMSLEGDIFDGHWAWQLVAAGDGRPQLKLARQDGLRGRFGAALVQLGSDYLLIGGVAAGRLLTHDEEIINLYTQNPVSIVREYRPLLVGLAAVSVPSKDPRRDELLIVGGGATCFSFGTFINHSLVLRSQTGAPSWQMQDLSKAANNAVSIDVSLRTSQHTTARQTRVERMTIDTAAQFEGLVKSRRPIVIEGTDIGPCVHLWDTEYLRSRVGADRQVTVHECPTPHMSFSDRNFKYTKTSFSDFLSKAAAGEHTYLRALSASNPADQPADLAIDYPEIATDFQLPAPFAYAQRNQHSSPLRISGAVSMWLHYDVMANILVQIRGTKRLLVFPPSDVTKLGFLPGASSSALNPFTTRPEDHAGLVASHAHEVELGPGDILFLPPMWLHAAQPTEGLSVAVNVFFRDEEMIAGYAAGRDVYGNRDLAAYERGRRDAQRIVAAFEGIPEDVKRFYLERIAGELLGGVGP